MQTHPGLRREAPVQSRKCRGGPEGGTSSLGWEMGQEASGSTWGLPPLSLRGRMGLGEARGDIPAIRAVLGGPGTARCQLVQRTELKVQARLEWAPVRRAAGAHLGSVARALQKGLGNREAQSVAPPHRAHWGALLHAAHPRGWWRTVPEWPPGPLQRSCCCRPLTGCSAPRMPPRDLSCALAS